MSFFRVFVVCTAVLFLGIGAASILKKRGNSTRKTEETVAVRAPESPKPIQKVAEIVKSKVDVSSENEKGKVDRVRRFFSKGMDKLPIVETITYTSRVSWLKGRPAWISDYATQYETSRHFIARGLNNKLDYFTQNVSPGDKFNVFRLDKNIQFYMLIDLSRCTMDFYYLDIDQDERVFLKSYPVGVGRVDSYSPSGTLTPTGKYALGSKVAIYKPGVEHFFQNQKAHMIEVFGTRWLPFEEELENCTDSAKGYGIHGVPCSYDKENDKLIEQEDGVGGYTSDGCIRMRKDDVEEIFAIVITKPTIVEVVKKKEDAKLPMSKENTLE